MIWFPLPLQREKIMFLTRTLSLPLVVPLVKVVDCPQPNPILLYALPSYVFSLLGNNQWNI